MADHYYSLTQGGFALRRQRSDWVVGTSGTGANPIEIRITDGALTSRQVYQALEWLADLVVVRDQQVIVAGDVLL